MREPRTRRSLRTALESVRGGGTGQLPALLAELCDLLDTPRPEPATPDVADNAYVFERSVTFNNGDGTTSPGRIDLYKRGCFVLEAKQGSARDSWSNPVRDIPPR